jgi:hypothetical protein
VCLRLPPHRPTRSQELMCCRIASKYLSWEPEHREMVFFRGKVFTPEQGEALEGDRGEMIDAPRLPTAVGHCCVVPAFPVP